jgi:SEFIR domain
MSEITVFISYSHDSDVHGNRVLGLSERLRTDGIATLLDLYVERGSPPEGWPRWMMNGLHAATYVVCVCTETYYRRFHGDGTGKHGKGADWEGALITQALYDSRHRTSRFVPIIFDGADEQYIPEPLRAQTHYVLTSEGGYEKLYDSLLGQAGAEAGAVGELRRKPRPTGQPASFGRGGDILPIKEARARIAELDAQPHTPIAMARLTPAVVVLLLLVIGLLTTGGIVLFRYLQTPRSVEQTDTSGTTTTTATSGTTVTDTVVHDTSGTTRTDSVANDTSTTTRHDPPPPPLRGSIRITSARGLPQGDIVHALNSSISAARRDRSAITGRLDRKFRPDHAFAGVTACDDTLDLTIRDLRTGQTDGATLTGEGSGSTVGAAAQDARSKLIVKIHEHFSGEDRP